MDRLFDYKCGESMENDLISREALKKAIRKRLGISSLKYLTEQEKVIVELIDNAPTVAVDEEIERQREELYQSSKKLFATARMLGVKSPKGEWIPVSERLPDKNGNYLCTVDYGENGVVVTQRNYWDTLGGFDKGYNKNYKVIAWQPLPEPYMRGGAEE